MVSFAILGGFDDYKKIKLNSKGMAAITKFFWQSAISFVAVYILYKTAQTTPETQLIIPFWKSIVVDLGVWFIPLSYLVIVATSNAVNITDGLDGLAIMPAILHGDLKKIAILTSQMGARNGGATPVNIYGKSKCELNDRFREIELTWRKSDITAVIFHPGWVLTDNNIEIFKVNGLFRGIIVPAGNQEIIMKAMFVSIILGISSSP